MEETNFDSLEKSVKLEICLKEIDLIQENISRFDQNGLRIKSWCLTLWTALVALGIQSQNIFIVVLSLIILICFSFIELTYRRFQSRFIQRSREIEDILRIKNLDIYDYALHYSATRSNLKRELSFVAGSPQFTFFYILLALMSIFVSIGLVLNPQMFSGFDASVI